MTTGQSERRLDCPSAQPDMEDARVLGVLMETPEGTRVGYLNAVQPVTPDLLELAEGFKPTQIMRFAARCEEGRCTHFDGRDCRLASRIIERMEAVSIGLPPCTIRRTCRWHAQEGPEACHRCSQVATFTTEISAELSAIAFPPADQVACAPQRTSTGTRKLRMTE